MCLFTACAQGYHNSSKLRPHPHAALSSLPFLPLFVFNPTFHFSLPLFQLFFPLLCSLQSSSVMHSLLFSFFPISPHTPPAFPLFYSDHSPSFQHPSSPWSLRVISILSSLCFHPSLVKSHRPRTQWADNSVMCICVASCHWTLFCQTPNKWPLLLLIHVWYVKRVRFTKLTIKAQCAVGSSAWVCECGGANDLRCSVLSQQTDIWVMKSWWSFCNKSSTWYRAMLP